MALEHFVEAWDRRAKKGPLDSARAPDVLMATGIERGDAAALKWLQREIAAAAKTAARRSVPEHLIADVESEVLSRIAVEGRISDWSAKGPLAGWVQIIVTREALARAGVVAGRASQTGLEQAILDDLERAPGGADSAVFKQKYGPQLRKALLAAGKRLSARDRTLLSMQYVDGASLDGIARAYQVHRATVCRWVNAARAAFMESVRDELAGLLAVRRLEVDSIVRGLYQCVDVSLARVLESTRSRQARSGAAAVQTLR